MTRTLSPAIAAAVAATQADEVHLLAFHFGAGTLRLATASTDISWGGHVYGGTGAFLSLSPAQESADLKAATMEVILGGVDPTVLGTLLTSTYLGREAWVWRAYLDPVTKAVLADPLVLFRGFMHGGFRVREDVTTPGKLGSIEVTAMLLSRVAELDERSGIRTNATAHQALFPGDLFFSFVDQLAYQPIVWKR